MINFRYKIFYQFKIWLKYTTAFVVISSFLRIITVTFKISRSVSYEIRVNINLDIITELLNLNVYACACLSWYTSISSIPSSSVCETTVLTSINFFYFPMTHPTTEIAGDLFLTQSVCQAQGYLQFTLFPTRLQRDYFCFRIKRRNLCSNNGNTLDQQLEE